MTTEATSLACILRETGIQFKAEKGPYKKRQKPCIVCGKPSVGVTSYVFQADGANKIGVPFCQLHLDNQTVYATPVFENVSALDRFKKEHPGLYRRYVAGKISLFVHLQEGSLASVE